MYTLVLDIADAQSGVAIFCGTELEQLCYLTHHKKKATKTLPERRKYVVGFRNLVSGEDVPVDYATEREAWTAIRNGRELACIVIESGFVRFPAAAMSLAEARGRALALNGAFSPGAPSVVRASPRSWRTGVERLLSTKIPSKRAFAKKAAVELTRQLLGHKFTDDEAEAYLLGLWAVKTGKAP